MQWVRIACWCKLSVVQQWVCIACCCTSSITCTMQQRHCDTNYNARIVRYKRKIYSSWVVRTTGIARSTTSSLSVRR